MEEVLWGVCVKEKGAEELCVGNARGGYGEYVACYAIAGTYFKVLLGWLVCVYG
jgi:hypothetical protein